MRSYENHVIVLTLAGALVGGAGVVGQHSEQATTVPTDVQRAGAQGVSGCSEGARAALETLSALAGRLEQARQANDPAHMRRTVDEVQGMLDGLRAQVSPCTQESGHAQGEMDHSAMGHDSSAKPATAVDPVRAMQIDPKSAPQAAYEGKTYYFCSESDRQKFLADPAKFVKTVRPDEP